MELTALKSIQSPMFKARECHMLRITWSFQLTGFELMRFYCIAIICDVTLYNLLDRSQWSGRSLLPHLPWRRRQQFLESVSTICKNEHCNIPENGNLETHHRENLKISVFGYHILKSVSSPNHIVYGLRYGCVNVATAAAAAAAA
jgi:hypothetical protein